MGGRRMRMIGVDYASGDSREQQHVLCRRMDGGEIKDLREPPADVSASTFSNRPIETHTHWRVDEWLWESDTTVLVCETLQWTLCTKLSQKYSRKR
ncbi:unnamed protein product [Caenorhabditis auriculariae]|uniref:Uncharacterized protein n=1 Tax=Caenorhabditis auriculariae TaxID=2777116 RepID=A0A8S1HJ36_9PELO|nr:unnamed protein product [Caenorhabditis auriculariae]